MHLGLWRRRVKTINEMRPGDIVLTRVGQEWGFLRPLVNWLLDGWGHAMIYVFNQNGVPYFVEARPKKGVSLVSARGYAGEECAVYRLKNSPYSASLAAEAALRWVDDPSALYGFIDIPLFVIPKLILRKLGIRLSTPKWEADHFNMCSELVWVCYAEVQCRFPDEEIPLPADFTKFPGLECVYEGRLDW